MTVYVEGVASLRRSLRVAGDMENLKEFRDGLKKAADIVAAEAKTRIPRKTGRAQESVRSGTSGNKAVVLGGKARVPYYGWLDFGTRIPVKGNPRSVGPWVKSGKGPREGRFIYPALEAKQDQVREAVEDAVDSTLRKAGL